MNKKITSILLIEDEPEVLRLQRLYVEQAGYTVHAVRSLKQATVVWRNHAIDLIILDLNLPDGDGINFCHAVRQTSSIPILIVTARTAEIDELKGLETGADAYLKKPFSPRVLIAYADKLLRRHGKEGLEVGDIRLEPAANTIVIAGRRINLTTIQTEIIELLMAHPERIYTRTEMLRHLDADGMVYDRSIDTHIKDIRKLLGVSHRSYIRTVYGKGYSFRAPGHSSVA